ncbi:MAG: type II toxin-antitoxin system VapC family toxin [Nitrospirae bacterium]|nr:type II toxin-antitoxin system VapC family toxin [Nitrospirota bacterium]
MRKLKIYLDTSIINFLFAKDAPEYMDITKNFFDNYLHDYHVYISEIVHVEIKRTKDRERKSLLELAIQDYQIEVYDTLSDEIERLAKKYVKEGIIPDTKYDDAMHIAFATYYEFDILLSWNFKHLANIKKQMEINSINEREGYSKKLYLLNPLEVIYEK